MTDILITTFLKRPYVFAFLAAYLLISICRRGSAKTFLYLAIGYTVAWLSEGLSIRFGFPYGLYHYVYENMAGEWMNWGVPVWDSVSYVFLCFAGLCVAEFIMMPDGMNRSTWIRSLNVPTLLKLNALAALLVTVLDVVIDPLAHQGDKWFLGRIYYYAHPGNYFDVPLSNFIGWFVVAFVINGLGLMMERSLREKESSPGLIGNLGGIGLYWGVFFFNMIVTLSIGDMTLAWASLGWGLIPALLLIRTIKKRRVFHNKTP